VLRLFWHFNAFFCRDAGVGFALTPGFSQVGGRGKKFNRFSGFSCVRKTVETVFVHPAF
jgi:hypothetical protein